VAERFQRKDVMLSDVSPQESDDGSREWCFTVRGLDDTVEAARFRTRAEAERAHRRLKRAIELLGLQIKR
jgi:hypothetical protein